jgi:hypothetical protein
VENWIAKHMDEIDEPLIKDVAPPNSEDTQERGLE